MSNRPAEIKQEVRSAAGLDNGTNSSRAELTDKVKADIDEDERKPSRVAPSAEGAVTFVGLTRDVRAWLAAEIAKVGRNGNGSGPNGHGPSASSDD